MREVATRGHNHAHAPRPIHRDAGALEPLPCARDRRSMDVIITRTDLHRAGFSRSQITDALRCCLIRVRRGLFVVRPGCSRPPHAALALLKECSAEATGAAPQTPDTGWGTTAGCATTARRDVMNVAPQTVRHDAAVVQSPAADLIALDAKGLRGHAARLRILTRTYVGDLAEDCTLSHVSAALLWGLPFTRPVQSRAEAVRPGRSRSYKQVIVRQRVLHRSEATTIDGLPVTTVRRTLLDVAFDYPLDVSVPMIDHALRTKQVSAEDLAELVESIHQRRGSVRARTAFALADPQRESPAESICAVRFHEYDIAGFVPQVSFGTNEEGFIARVDFLHREAKVIVEVNGETKYTDGEAGAARARRERRQDYQLRNLGYRVYQLTWADLFSPAVFHELKRAVSRAG